MSLSPLSGSAGVICWGLNWLFLLGFLIDLSHSLFHYLSQPRVHISPLSYSHRKKSAESISDHDILLSFFHSEPTANCNAVRMRDDEWSQDHGNACVLQLHVFLWYLTNSYCMWPIPSVVLHDWGAWRLLKDFFICISGYLNALENLIFAYICLMLRHCALTWL